MITVVTLTSDGGCAEDLSAIFAMCLPETELIFCSSGAELLNQVSSKPPNLVIVDFAAAGTEGLNLIKQVRVRSSSPIVILSYDDSPDFIKRAVDNGADRCFRKQIKPFEFAAHLRALLRSS